MAHIAAAHDLVLRQTRAVIDGDTVALAEIQREAVILFAAN